MQTITQRRDVRGYGDLDQRDRRSVERVFYGQSRLFRSGIEGPGGIGRADIEMRLLPIIAHEKRAAVFQPAIEVHHGSPTAARLSDDPIAGLENDTAGLGQQLSCRSGRLADCRRDPRYGLFR